MGMPLARIAQGWNGRTATGTAGSLRQGVGRVRESVHVQWGVHLRAQSACLQRALQSVCVDSGLTAALSAPLAVEWSARQLRVSDDSKAISISVSFFPFTQHAQRVQLPVAAPLPLGLLLLLLPASSLPPAASLLAHFAPLSPWSSQLRARSVQRLHLLVLLLLRVRALRWTWCLRSPSCPCLWL
jgi:hypothetical protein